MLGGDSDCLGFNIISREFFNLKWLNRSLKYIQDCRTQDRECTCTEMSEKCRCGLSGRCLPDRTCHASECATLGFKECQCKQQPLTDGPSSKTTMMNMCGVCCEMPDKDGHVKCVGAEEAAHEIYAQKTYLPPSWPDEDYRGPNVTIRLCQGHSCNETWLRAWPVGSVCVTQNVVGMCSPRGLCKLDHITPRSNVYPDIMNIHLRGTKNQSRNIKPVSIIFVCSWLSICLIK